MTDLLTDGPATDRVTAPSSPVIDAHGRRRWWSLASVVVLVAGAALVSLPAVVGFEQGVRPVVGDDVELITLSQFDEGGIHALGYRHGQLVTLAVPLTNQGPLPVDVDAIRLDDRAQPMLAQVATDSRRGSLPFRLGAGETVEVSLSFRFDNCEFYTERAMDRYPSALVDYSVLGIPASREVAFDHPLVVRSAMMRGCADRVTDRGYNRRDGG